MRFSAFQDTDRKGLLTFIAITLFYFFETTQMTYFNVLAPFFMGHHIYNAHQVAALAAAYYYGDMAGLIPIGFALDRFQLRHILPWVVLGTVCGAFTLAFSHTYSMQWLARFACGFFGGTFGFVGGIRILLHLFPRRFTFFMGIFLSAGMLAGLICQYPLLLVVHASGAFGAMLLMAILSLFIGLFNLLYLHPEQQAIEKGADNKPSLLKNFYTILKNPGNTFDCLLVVFLDTPVSLVGSLWGIVLITGYYHFSAGISAWIVMALFLGLMIGMPIWGAISDRFNYPTWVVASGASSSALVMLLMIACKHSSPALIALLFFLLGLLSSCQTLGFTWLTKNMKPELIGLNSALNSVIFMCTNGLFKQYGAVMIAMPALMLGSPSVVNLLLLMLACFVLSTAYTLLRRKVFGRIY